MKFKFSFILILILILIFFSLSSCKTQNGSFVSKIERGLLDLSSLCSNPQDGSQNCPNGILPTLDLNGEWEFYGGEFIEPQPIGTDTVGAGLKPDPTNGVDYIPVPGSWNDFLAVVPANPPIQNNSFGGKGYATYRLRVLLPSIPPRESCLSPSGCDNPLGIRIPNIGTAYELWIGNRLYGKGGIVSDSEDTSKPGFHPHLYMISKEDFSLDADGNRVLDISIRVSNFHQSSGGLWYPIKFGDYLTLSEKSKQQIILDFFLFGSILIMGLYHFGLYYLRKKDRSALWFGAYCLAINLRMLLVGDERYLETSFPDYSPFFTFIEYLDFALLIPIFFNFFCYLFPHEMGDKSKKGILGTGLGFAFLILILPAYYYTKMVTAIQLYMLIAGLYIIYGMIRAVRNKREGAKIFFAGFLFFFAVILHDVLYYQMILKTFPLFAFGLFGFTFSQAAVLSMRFSGAFLETELLSESLEQKSQRLEETALELTKLTESLETKVAERTLELEETKSEIEDLNHFTHKVNTLSNLRDIFIEVSKYMYENLSIVGLWLFLPDENKEYMYAYKAYSYEKLPQEKYNYLMTKRIPLKENEGGMFYKTYQRKKSLYLHRIPKFEFEIDREFVETLGVKSFLYVPLIRKDECVGIFAFSNLGQEMKLSKKEIRKIGNLCSQIAGVIDTNHLLQQVEAAKRETEKLNEFSKLINSTSDLSVIFREVYSYLKESMGFNILWVLLVSKDNKTIYSDPAMAIYDFSEEIDIDFFNNFNMDLNERMGTLFQTYSHKVPLYVLDASKRDNNKGEFKNQYNGNFYSATKVDLKIAIKGKLKSFIQIPLILQNNVIGIVTLSIHNKQFSLNKDEIEKLIRFSNQIAGVIYNAQLLKQTEEAKKQTDIEKEKVIIAQTETEKQKRETEELNILMKSLNEDLDIKVIMKKVHIYIKEHYNIPYYGLGVVDKSKENIASIDALFPDFLTEEEKQNVNLFSTRVKGVLGAHALAFKVKKPIFIPQIRKSGITPEELYLQETLKFESLLMIPLILQNELIGFLDLYNVGKLYLSKDDITKLSILGDQLAGIIYDSNLLKEVQEERERAIIAQQETEKQKKEIEKLNQLIKSLNENLNIEIILEKINVYINENYGIQNLGLYEMNSEKTHVSLVSASFLKNTIEEEKNIIYKSFIPIHGEKGAHAFVCKTKKYFYIPNVQSKRILSSVTPEELFVIEKFKIQSFMMIPLLLNNEVIGILDFSNYLNKMELSKEEITRLSILGEQLAGIIHGSNLFQKVQEERERAILAKKETEKAKEEIAELNHFLKSIQEKLSISEVMKEAQSYIDKNYNIGYYSLWLYNQVENSLHFHSGHYPDQEKIELFLKNGNKVLDLDTMGAHSFAAKKKKYTFLYNLGTRKTIPEEDENQEILKMASLLMIPLYVQDTLVGMLDFSHGSEKIKLDRKDLESIYIFCQQIAGVIQNISLMEKIEHERQRSEKLLLNILPQEVAEELKEKGFAEPTLFESVSVMFTDFKGFTKIAEILSPQELIKDLDACFVQFDKISERYNLEKLKTIGDSYMCAGGIPRRNTTHAIDCVLAALEIQAFMNMMKELKELKGFPYWELRLGIHSGPLVAGVIGERKFAYDVWGDTVNTASRMESSGTPGKINISGSTYELVKHLFDCEYRGRVNAKNKGEVDMYYVNGIKSEFSLGGDGRIPNEKFKDLL